MQNSCIFHRENVIDFTSFINDPLDKELYCIASFIQENSQFVIYDIFSWVGHNESSTLKFSYVESCI